jgi:hypothetical protein
MPLTLEEQDWIRNAILGVKASCRRYDVPHYATIEIEKFLWKIEQTLKSNNVETGGGK